MFECERCGVQIFSDVFVCEKCGCEICQDCVNKNNICLDCEGENE